MQLQDLYQRRAARTWPSLGTSLAVVGIALLISATRVSVGTAASWSLQEPKTQGTQARLSGVSCGASESCTAVGHFLDAGGKEFELGESWNGKEWSFRSVKENAGSGLLGVSCPTSEWCMAAGRIGSGAAESARAVFWTKAGGVGGYPTIGGPKEAKGFGLAGISCTSKEACMAVGHYISKTGQELPLAEVWNGKAWAVQEALTPKEAQVATFSGVSCTSAESCTAVGYYNKKESLVEHFIERWNGKAWTMQVEASLGFSSLNGVSCVSVEACIAVGFVKAEPLAERWNGKEWIFNRIEVFDSDKLLGVSCTTSESCMAVGHYTTSKELTLGYRWNGKEWLKQEPINPGAAEAATLESISCPAVEKCMSVGHYIEEGKEVLLGEKYS